MKSVALVQCHVYTATSSHSCHWDEFISLVESSLFSQDHMHVYCTCCVAAVSAQVSISVARCLRIESGLSGNQYACNVLTARLHELYGLLG